MIVETGIQPNCSELIIRLGDVTRDYVVDELEKIGIKEYFVRNKYSWMADIPEWDDETSSVEFIPAKSLGKEVLKAYDTMNYTSDQKVADKAKKILEKNNFSFGNVSLDLIDGDPKHIKYAPDIHIGRDPYIDREETEIAIWYHQHCQPQGFPTLQKIAEHFGSEVEAHDGGSIDTYERWENGEELEDE